MIRDLRISSVATTFGSRFVSEVVRSSAAAARRAAASALRTTRRIRWTRVLSSIGTRGRPIGFFPDQRGIPIELGLMGASGSKCVSSLMVRAASTNATSYVIAGFSASATAPER